MEGARAKLSCSRKHIPVFAFINPKIFYELLSKHMHYATDMWDKSYYYKM